MPPCPELGQSLASEAMKQLLLICAVVALVGCGESAEKKAAKAKAAAADWKVIEKAIREELKKPTGGLGESEESTSQQQTTDLREGSGESHAVNVTGPHCQ